MIVIADTSPLNYLILIQEIEILRKLYSGIIVPQTVYDELLRPATPNIVREWVSHLPEWIEVRAPRTSAKTLSSKLDPGERDAILLAEELRADQLIIDDREGRREAQKRGLLTIGTLGVLREASVQGLVNIRAAVKRLEATSFHIAPEVLARVLTNPIP